MAPKRHAAYRPMSPERAAWVRMGANEVILWDHSRHLAEEDDDEVKEGHTLIFHVSGQARKWHLQLGTMTEAEIVALKQFMDHVFEQAIPLAHRLDAEARQSWEEHGIDYARLYRVAPQFVVRERVRKEHDPGVQGGPDGVDGVDGS